MHDIADLETRGVPAMFIASDAFVVAADSQSKALGFPSLQRVFVPHPVQDRTDDEMSALADSAYELILEALTSRDI